MVKTMEIHHVRNYRKTRSGIFIYKMNFVFSREFHKCWSSGDVMKCAARILPFRALPLFYLASHIRATLILSQPNVLRGNSVCRSGCSERKSMDTEWYAWSVFYAECRGHYMKPSDKWTLLGKFKLRKVGWFCPSLNLHLRVCLVCPRNQRVQRSITLFTSPGCLCF